MSQLLGEAQATNLNPQKVCAIIGTSDGGKNTLSFLNDFMRGFPQQDIVNLNELEVGPFTYDRSKHTSDDTHLTIVENMINADLIVLATPVYWYAMSGSMKDFIDRFSDLLSGPLKSKAEGLYGKKLILLSTGSDETLPMGFEVPFVGTAIYFGMDYMGAKYRGVS